MPAPGPLTDHRGEGMAARSPPRDHQGDLRMGHHSNGGPRQPDQPRPTPARPLLRPQHERPASPRHRVDRLRVPSPGHVAMSITFWTRIEPLARRADMGASLQARMRDPLWVLAMQQMIGELTAEDSGSPV